MVDKHILNEENNILITHGHFQDINKSTKTKVLKVVFFFSIPTNLFLSLSFLHDKISDKIGTSIYHLWKHLDRCKTLFLTVTDLQSTARGLSAWQTQILYIILQYNEDTACIQHKFLRLPFVWVILRCTNWKICKELVKVALTRSISRAGSSPWFESAWKYI